MKHKRNNFTVDYRRLCVLALAAAMVTALLRIALTPIAVTTPLPYGIVLVVTGIALAAVLLFCAGDRSTTIAVGGKAALLSSVAAALTGAAFVVFSFVSFVDWKLHGILPFPDKVTVKKIDELFFTLLTAVGVLAGVYLILIAVRWLRSGITATGIFPLLSLSPIVWVWVRLIRYITAYVSLIGLFRDLYDLATILFEMVFFLLFARYVARQGERRSRLFIGVSLCTGFLCTVSGVTQAAFFFAQNQAAYDTCALVVAPDFTIAVLAFVTAFSQCYGTAVEESEEPEPQEEVEEVAGEDGAGAEFLIDDEWFTVADNEQNDE